jgi:hypothetical protein
LNLLATTELQMCCLLVHGHCFDSVVDVLWHLFDRVVDRVMCYEKGRGIGVQRVPKSMKIGSGGVENQ